MPCSAWGVCRQTDRQTHSRAGLCTLAHALGAPTRTQGSWQLTGTVLAAPRCHSSKGVAGGSSLLVMTPFAASLNSHSQNPGRSPAPHSVIDVVPAEGRGRSHKKQVLILLCHFSSLFQISEMQVQRKGNYFLQGAFI